MVPSWFSPCGGSLHVEAAGRPHLAPLSLGSVTSCGPVRAEASLVEVPGGVRIRVHVVPDAPVTLRHAEIKLRVSVSAASGVLVNGYQSWTETRERSASDRQLPLVPPLRWLLGPFGDYRFAPYSLRRGVFHGFTYGVVRNGEAALLAGALSEDGGFLRIDVDVTDGTIVLAADVDGCPIDAPLTLLDVFLAQGTDDTIFDAWFTARGDRPTLKPTLSGWNSWYLHFTDVTEAHVHSVIRGARALGAPLDVIQIDDGYQTAVGDHLDVNRAKFPRGLAPVAHDIAAAGHTPGLWLAPFVCTTPSRMFRQRSDLLERDARGQLFRTGYNPWWKGHFYALDVDHPEARAVVETTLRDAMGMGFSFLKLDFLFAASLTHRKNNPRGKRMRDTMRWLRACTEGATVLGCGVPLGSALGLVDYCRIGSDVSPRWEDRLLARMQYRERPSTRNSLASTAGRRHLDTRGFANDADVFFLRRGHVQMTAEERRTLLLVNAAFSALLFTSDALEGYGPDEKQVFASLFPRLQRHILQVTERDLTVDATLRVGGRTYRLCANLGEHPVTFTLPPTPCFEATRGVFDGGDVVVPPHGALLIHVITGGVVADTGPNRAVPTTADVDRGGDGDVVVAGSPHIFPGSDCALTLTANGWTLSSETPATGEVVLLVRSEADTVAVNGIARPVTTVGVHRTATIQRGGSRD